MTPAAAPRFLLRCLHRSILPPAGESLTNACRWVGNVVSFRDKRALGDGSTYDAICLLGSVYIRLGVARQTDHQILGAAGPGSRYVLADWEPRPPLGPDPIVVARLGWARWVPRYPRWSTASVVCSTSMSRMYTSYVLRKYVLE